MKRIVLIFLVLVITGCSFLRNKTIKGQVRQVGTRITEYVLTTEDLIDYIIITETDEQREYVKKIIGKNVKITGKCEKKEIEYANKEYNHFKYYTTPEKIVVLKE